MKRVMMSGAAIVLMMTGCVTQPVVQVRASGIPIAAGSRYHWFAPEGGQSSLPEGSRARLMGLLAARGIVDAGAGKPDYLLLVSQARRPARTGLAATAEAPEPGQEPVWLETPGKKRRQISTLQLHFMDPATGQEMGGYTAEAVHRVRDNAVILDRLIDGVLAPAR